MAVEYLEPTVELVEEIARNMRQADIDEAWASDNLEPLPALMKSWKMSDYSVVISIDGEACVMIGLVRHDLLSGNGVPWMLGTDASLKHKKRFFTEVPDVIADMLKVCSKLYNYVHCKNRVSVRWLKTLGFIFEDPAPYGCEQELFQKFYIERD